MSLSGSEFGLYVFDLDGTLYRGESVIPNAVEAVARVRAGGGQIAYLTNNSSQTRQAFVDKLTRMGFEAHLNEIESSATGTATYLLEKGIKHVQILGEPGLAATLREAGIAVEEPDEEWSDRAEAVAVGIFRQLRYEHLAKAMASIRAGAHFVATNADSTFPMEGGRLIPGAGTIVRAVETCSGQSPFIVGKPNPFLIEHCIRKAGVSPAETLVVGDRLDTDIASGIAAGTPTLLVLTGVTETAPEGQRALNDLSQLS
jgi:4-nitrophenyl phosphatase